jgi:hypothetical protein
MSMVSRPVVFALRISSEMHEDLRLEAESQQERMATIARFALRDYLRARGRGKVGLSERQNGRFVIRKEKVE